MGDLTTNTLHFAHTVIYVFYRIVNTNSDYIPYRSALAEWSLWWKQTALSARYEPRFCIKCGLILIFKGLKYAKPLPMLYIFSTWRHSKIIKSVTLYHTNTMLLYSSVYKYICMQRSQQYSYFSTLYMPLCRSLLYYALGPSFINKLQTDNILERKA
jgi:hypothetical protein